MNPCGMWQNCSHVTLPSMHATLQPLSADLQGLRILLSNMFELSSMHKANHIPITASPCCWWSMRPPPSVYKPLPFTTLVHKSCLQTDVLYETTCGALQIKTLHPLAVTYNDQSPLENHHHAAAVRLLLQPEYRYLPVSLHELSNICMQVHTNKLHGCLCIHIKQQPSFMRCSLGVRRRQVYHARHHIIIMVSIGSHNCTCELLAQVCMQLCVTSVTDWGFAHRRRLQHALLRASASFASCVSAKC